LTDPRVRLAEKVWDSMAANYLDSLLEAAFSLNKIEVDVTVQFEGNPAKAVAATVAIRVDAAGDKPEIRALIQRAVEISTVANSVRSGFPVTVIGVENG
jgi:OsmC-like protein